MGPSFRFRCVSEERHLWRCPQDMRVYSVAHISLHEVAWIPPSRSPLTASTSFMQTRGGKLALHISVGRKRKDKERTNDRARRGTFPSPPFLSLKIYCTTEQFGPGRAVNKTLIKIPFIVKGWKSLHTVRIYGGFLFPLWWRACLKWDADMPIAEAAPPAFVRGTK